MIKKQYIYITFFFIIISIILPIFFINLKIILPTTSTILYDKNHIEIWEIINDKKTRNRYINLKQIPIFTKNAIVLIEDKSFYSNIWIDFKSILRALQNNIITNKNIEWASTISSQVIRNIYWLNKERTYIKKIKEFYFALILNRQYSKDKILEIYLNIINFWHLNVWIESAAKYYFWKDIMNLTKAEQLSLLVLPKNPHKYDIYNNNDNFKKRFNLLANYLEKEWLITKTEKKNILNEKLLPIVDHKNKLPYIIDYIKKTNISNSKKSIKLTIDYNLTKKINKIARNTIIPLAWKNVWDYWIIISDIKTSNILVMIWWDDYYNKNWEVNSTLSLRQVGSTLKPFTYTLAFKDLWYSPETVITDLPIQFDTLEWNSYSPKNYSLDYKWEVSLAEALSQSINIPAIKLTQKIWLNRLHNFLKTLWITSLNKESSYYWLALTLWVWEVSLFELTRAYTIFTNKWKLCKFNIIKKTDKKCTAIINEKYTNMTNSILKNRYFKLWWFPINSNLDFKDKNVFVKTWTSRNFVDNYSIWYTKNYLIWVWVWNKDWQPMKWVSWSTWAWEIFRNIVYELENEKNIPKTIIQKKKNIDYLEIISPLNKSTYKINKSRPLNTQKISLDFKTNIVYDAFKWFINNKPFKINFWLQKP